MAANRGGKTISTPVSPTQSNARLDSSENPWNNCEVDLI